MAARNGAGATRGLRVRAGATRGLRVGLARTRRLSPLAALALAVLLLVSCVLGVLGAGAANAGGIRPDVQYPRGCHIGEVGLDSRGGEHTFGRCAQRGPIWYFVTANGDQTRQQTPYAGDVSAVRQDSSGTFLLYAQCRTGEPPAGSNCSTTYALYLGHRRNDGTFDARRLLDVDGSGDQLIVRNGAWWAFWVDGKGKFKQARTMHGDGSASVVQGWDKSWSSPSVARVDGGLDATFQRGTTEVWVAHASYLDGTWHARRLVTVEPPQQADNSQCGQEPGQDPSSLCYENGEPTPQPSIAVDPTGSYVAFYEHRQARVLKGALSTSGAYQEVAVPNVNDGSIPAGRAVIRSSHGVVWLGWFANQSNFEVDPWQTTIVDVTGHRWWHVRADSHGTLYNFHDIQLFGRLGRVTMSTNTTRTFVFS